MVAQQIHRLRHGVFHAVKSPQPGLKVNAAVAHHVDMVLGDAPLDQVADHHVGVDMGHAAVGMADDHDLFHPQLDDAYQ